MMCDAQPQHAKILKINKTGDDWMAGERPAIDDKLLRPRIPNASFHIYYKKIYDA